MTKTRPAPVVLFSEDYHRPDIRVTLSQKEVRLIGRRSDPRGVGAGLVLSGFGLQ
jgi:hypothetical protein